MIVNHLTRGRKKRKRAAGAGTGVSVGRHFRTPRGPNRGKPKVVVDGYSRGKPAKRRKKR